MNNFAIRVPKNLQYSPGNIFFLSLVLTQKAFFTAVPTSSSGSPHKNKFQSGNLHTHFTSANNKFSFIFEINLFQVILM